MSAFDAKAFATSVATLAPQLHLAEAEIREIDDAVEDLKSKRDVAAYGPAHRDDVLALLGATVDGLAAEYRKRRFPDALNPWLASADAQLQRASLRDFFFGPSGLDETALAFFLGDVLKTRFQEGVHALRWPNADGITHAERAAAVANLNTQIGELESRKQALIDTLRNAGLNVREDLIDDDAPPPFPEGPSVIEPSRDDRRQADDAALELLRGEPTPPPQNQDNWK